MRLLFALIAGSLFLSGCGLFQKELVPVRTETNLPRARVPAPVETLPVKFHVVNQDNLDAFLEGRKDVNGAFVFIALDPDDYENLSLNMAEFLRYLKSQKAVVLYYESFLYREKTP